MKVEDIVLAGGVACNSYLRKELKVRAEQEQMNLFYPAPILCTDNAAMIACAGFYKLKKGETSKFNLSPNPSLKL